MAGIGDDVHSRVAISAGMMRTALSRMRELIITNRFRESIELIDRVSTRVDKIMAGESPPVDPDQAPHLRQDER